MKIPVAAAIPVTFTLDTDTGKVSGFKADASDAHIWNPDEETGIVDFASVPIAEDVKERMVASGVVDLATFRRLVTEALADVTVKQKGQG